MRRLGIERAHVVGHSSSAVIALQLALDFPDGAQTLALMEPARPAPPTEVQVAFRRDAPVFAERLDLLRSWLPGATHLLHLQSPRGMAEGLASFYARHAVTATSPVEDLGGG